MSYLTFSQRLLPPYYIPSHHPQWKSINAQYGLIYAEILRHSPHVLPNCDFHYASSDTREVR